MPARDREYIKQEVIDSEYYNAKVEITLKAFPITMTLEEIFEIRVKSFAYIVYNGYLEGSI